MWSPSPRLARRCGERQGVGGAVNQTDTSEAERPRPVGIASQALCDHAESQDIVQPVWLRQPATDAEIHRLPVRQTT